MTGKFTFSSVSEGEHTLYVKNRNGGVIAQTPLVLQVGVSPQLNGTTATLSGTGNGQVITFELDGSTLTPIQITVANPKTGTDSENVRYEFLIALSISLVFRFCCSKRSSRSLTKC